MTNKAQMLQAIQESLLIDPDFQGNQEDNKRREMAKTIAKARVTQMENNKLVLSLAKSFPNWYSKLSKEYPQIKPLPNQKIINPLSAVNQIPAAPTTQKSDASYSPSMSPAPERVGAPMKLENMNFEQLDKLYKNYSGKASAWDKNGYKDLGTMYRRKMMDVDEEKDRRAKLERELFQSFLEKSIFNKSKYRKSGYKPNLKNLSSDCDCCGNMMCGCSSCKTRGNALMPIEFSGLTSAQYREWQRGHGAGTMCSPCTKGVGQATMPPVCRHRIDARPRKEVEPVEHTGFDLNLNPWFNPNAAQYRQWLDRRKKL